ncbi:ABC transporter substrate-binding protein [Streptomyces sp. SL13]|uniref:ABC transporter substrate-binding protein n=1 Tax=Streptantibioticus silvisoli TaxID=2705255 RepID=A0AA90H2M3_9ACTN|nr:ABC transporter substrate-binding protein [Streptantibioticus silvisoli]MDI5963695.1 ABC transporter substrate-binding protein [Streptantibioticus silvisoli]MDI5969535.1 ABC transporter substrate-binding protein [Streptantibioticus silvisoli]
MWHKKIVSIAATTVLAAGLTACSGGKSGDTAAGNGSSPTVTIALSNQANQSYLPLILAQRLGFFKKQGVNVKIDNLQATAQVTDALLTGDAQAMIGFYDHNLDLQAKGKQTESVIQLLQAPGMVEMGRTNESINSPADLRGKTIGVTSLGSSTSYLGSYLAVHNNIPIDQTHLVAVAAGPTFVAAFQHNRVDAGVTTEPTISTLLTKHLAKITVDMRTAAGTKAALGGPYPGTCLLVQTAWANSHKPTVQKMVDALYDTLLWIESHSAAQITAQVPADFYQGSGKEQYTQALANGMGMYNPTGQMPTDAPQTVLRVLTAVDPNVKGHKIDLAKTYTDEFVQQASQAKPTS